MFKIKAVILLIFLSIESGLIYSAARIVSVDTEEEISIPDESKENEKNKSIGMDQKLIDASKAGDLDTVKKILNLKPAVKGKDELGRTALHWACYNGHLEIVKLLIFAGFDTNENCIKGFSSLDYAIFGEHKEIIKYFLENNIKIESSSVCIAPMAKDKEIIDMLLPYFMKTSMDDFTYYGMIGNIISFKHDEVRLIKKLLDYKKKLTPISNFLNRQLDVNVEFDGIRAPQIPLVGALSFFGHHKSLALLLSYGAKPIIGAGQANDMSMFRFLLEVNYSHIKINILDQIFYDFENMVENIVSFFAFKNKPKVKDGDYRKSLRVLLEYNLPIVDNLDEINNEHFKATFGENCNKILMLCLLKKDWSSHLRLFKLLLKYEIKNSIFSPKIIFNFLGLKNNAYLPNHRIYNLPFHTEMFKNFSIKHSDINSLDNLGMTPLMYAAARNNHEGIKDLLDLCQLYYSITPDLSVTNENGKTALSLAYKHKSLEAVSQLLKFLDPVIKRINCTNGLPKTLNSIVTAYLFGTKMKKDKSKK